jgi:hypothetical protein
LIHRLKTFEPMGSKLYWLHLDEHGLTLNPTLIPPRLYRLIMSIPPQTVAVFFLIPPLILNFLNIYFPLLIGDHCVPFLFTSPPTYLLISFLAHESCGSHGDSWHLRSDVPETWRIWRWGPGWTVLYPMEVSIHLLTLDVDYAIIWFQSINSNNIKGCSFTVRVSKLLHSYFSAPRGAELL